MNKFTRLLGLLLILVALAPLAAFAQEPGAPPEESGAAAAPLGSGLAGMGAGLGAGLIAIGAGFGIGKLAAAAADGVARQPSAASSITGAVNLPLFLLEGVSIIGLVVCLLVVFVRK